ncbi:MAG: DUF1684 domain-containing protein [Gemmatimonadaceae bacterium]
MQQSVQPWFAAISNSGIRAGTQSRRMMVLAATLLAPIVGACAGDVAPPPISDADYQAAFAKHKDVRTAFIAAPGKAISYSGLRWIPQGASTIGGDSTNAVILTGRDVPAKVGTLIRNGDEIKFEPAPGAAVTIDSAPAVAKTLIVEGGTTPASRVYAGTSGFRIIKRVDSIGVRSWDADRATNNGLAPLEYFPLDKKYRFGGTFVRNAKPDTQAVPTVSGVAEEYINLGLVAVTIEGKKYELTAYAGSNPTDLFFTFNDATSGEETYGFRFVHAPIDTVKNTVVLDFNLAYNPECAFSSFTTCPLPTPNNRISARLEAGEKTPKHTDGKQ